MTENNTPHFGAIRDFGFVTMAETDLNNENNILVGTLRAQVENSHLALRSFKELVWPLLEQLKRDPIKDIIKWPGPDRVKAINDLMKAIEALLP